MGDLRLNDISYTGHAESDVKLTQTLTAGSTTLTFTDNRILADSLISVFSEAYYISKTQSAGSVVLTFPVQATDMDVKILVR